jgi:hypothetical protein
MKGIITHFVFNIEHYENEASYTDNQASDVYQGKCFVPFDVSKSNF